LSSTATIDPLVPPKPASGALQIAAATVGNALEWFDILVYAYFAPYIANVFFRCCSPSGRLACPTERGPSELLSWALMPIAPGAKQRWRFPSG